MPVELTSYAEDDAFRTPATDAQVPIHIPSGMPGDPETTGSATIGDRTIAFPIQQDTAAEQQVWVKRMNEYDRVKRETEKAEQDAAYLKNLMMNQRTTSSARQVEAAIQFQAMRNYERDLTTAKSAGLSESQAALQALVRNPKVLGSGFGAGVRALQPRQTIENAGPASVITDPETGQRLGVRIPTGPTGGTFRSDAPVKRPGSLTQVESARIRQLDREEIELKKALPDVPGRWAGKTTKDAYSSATNSIANIRKERDKLLGTAAISTGQPPAKPIRVRRKSDGKTFTYPGAASDVPDKYEVLP